MERMIEMKSYSTKIETSSEFQKFQIQQEHNKSKTITLAVSMMLFSIFVLSLQVCFTKVNVNDFNMKVFNDDQDKASMKEFLTFLIKYNRPYTHRLEVSQRYRVFKNNYQMMINHNKDPAIVPFLLELN